MVIRNIEEIQIPNYIWRKRSKINKTYESISFDTETINGKAILICDSNKRLLFPDNFDSLLNYLFYTYYQNTINFFYNIDYDTNAIIKWLPDEHIENLANYDETVYTDRNYNKYRINIIPDKLFKISKNHHVVKFFDLAQFYKKLPLQILAERIGMSKTDIEDIKNLDYYKIQTDYNYRNKIIERCYTDCIITNIYAKKLINTINKFVKVRNFYSGASFSRQLILQNLNDKYLKLPSLKFMDFALKSYNAGRFEITKRGYFEKMIERDINAAYPAEISNLLDCEGVYLYNTEYEPDSTHSFFNCDIEIYESYLSPIRFQLPNSKKDDIFQDIEGNPNLIIYPNGNIFNTYITKTEYELLEKYGYKVKIHKACHLFNNEAKKPFNYLEDIYYYRKEIQKEEEELADTIKTTLNGIYGTFINVNKGKGLTTIEDEHTNNFVVIDNIIYFSKSSNIAGNMFNPVWASEICSNVRCKIFDDFKPYEDKIICIATDGVKLIKDVPIKESNKLGMYDKSKINTGILIGSGVYQFGDKVKFRGFDSKLNLKNLLMEHQNDKIIESVINRVLSLKQCVNNLEISILDDEYKTIKKKLDINSINEFVKINRNLNINFDKKRKWYREFDNCKDVLDNNIDSIPLIINTNKRI